MKPELLKALEANMFDHHENEALEAEAFLKGQAKGMEKGARQEREKNDADNAARDSKRADFLRSQNVPDSVIAAMLALKELIYGSSQNFPLDIFVPQIDQQRRPNTDDRVRQPPERPIRQNREHAQSLVWQIVQANLDVRHNLERQKVEPNDANRVLPEITEKARRPRKTRHPDRNGVNQEPPRDRA